jgi:hypothetical protein
MSGEADWRDASGYRRLSGIDRAGLMWEWLRRDPGYVAWHARASMVTCGTDANMTPDALSWGLHFRGKSRNRRSPGAADLACRFRSRHDLGRGRAGFAR